MVDCPQRHGFWTHLSGISMLTGSRYVEITADFVRRFAALEGIMRIYTEPAIFDAVLADALSAGA